MFQIEGLSRSKWAVSDTNQQRHRMVLRLQRINAGGADFTRAHDLSPDFGPKWASKVQRSNQQTARVAWWENSAIHVRRCQLFRHLLVHLLVSSMFTDDCPSSYPKFRWQLELPTPDHLRENRYGFLRLAPCYVLIIPMAFIARRAAKLAIVAALQVWLVPSFGAKDPSRSAVL